MKKINLIILFVLFKILSAFSQSEEDNTGFKLKKLKFEEATLVSSYYTLYRYQNRCFRAANFIVSHLYVQEMIKDFILLFHGIGATKRLEIH